MKNDTVYDRKNFSHWAYWNRLVIPVTLEAEAGELHYRSLLELQSEFKTSLGNFGNSVLRLKSKKKAGVVLRWSPCLAHMRLYIQSLVLKKRKDVFPTSGS